MKYKLQIQFFGTGTSKAGGGSGGGGGTTPNGGVTAAQNKTIDKIANKTRNLKNEQYRIVNENGEVVLEKRGNNDSVALTLGEKRQYLNGAVSIHNHPDNNQSGIGGTFSDADLSDFANGARQIVVAAPEGNYKLTNVKYGTKDQYSGWHAMRDAMDKAGITRERSFLDIRNEAMKSKAYQKQRGIIEGLSQQWMKARSEGKPQSVLDSLNKRFNEQSEIGKRILRQQQRIAETKPYDDFYRKNASKYGFKYEFIKNG